MADAIYRVGCADGDEFFVEIIRPGVLPKKAAGFATEAEVND